jgi:signal recognition particle subunit SRP54
VNQLVDRFFEARKMMMQMARGGGGMPGMPGAPGMGLGKKAKGRQAPQQKKGKGKRVSGNPAKRAQQEKQAQEKPAAASGSAFGLGEDQVPEDFDPSQLPDLSKYLK